LKKAERLLISHNERKSGARPGTAGSLRAMGMTGFSNQEGMNQYIHGYNESSPRTQGQKLTDYLANELHQKGILPVRIFSMADSRRTGQVRFSDILVALEKILPSLTKEFLEQIPMAFMRSPDDVLSQPDFEALFAPDSQVSYTNTMPKPSAQKLKNKLEARAEHDQEYTGYMKHLGLSLENDGTKPQSFFRGLDRQRNGILQCREIKEGVKDNLQEAFGGMNYNKLEKALDVNGTGIISEEEFVKLVNDAKQS
jgi:Ca2+-binding EF-hand superfamily protein